MSQSNSFAFPSIVIEKVLAFRARGNHLLSLMRQKFPIPDISVDALGRHSLHKQNGTWVDYNTSGISKHFTNTVPLILGFRGEGK